MNRIISSVLLASALALSGGCTDSPNARKALLTIDLLAVPLGGGGTISNLPEAADDLSGPPDNRMPGYGDEPIPIAKFAVAGEWGANEDRGAAREVPRSTKRSTTPTRSKPM